MENLFICIICPHRKNGNECSRFDRIIHSAEDIPKLCREDFAKSKIKFGDNKPNNNCKSW